VPTVFRGGNVRVAVLTRNEHEPPHVHVEHPDGVIVVLLDEKTKTAQLREATRKMKVADERGRIEPRADSVSYDEKKGLIVLNLHGGAILSLPVSVIRELRKARPKELKSVRAGFGGESISLEALDIDISIPGLLRDIIGMTSAAALLGRKGGSVKSEAKALAVRENGKRGGRPQKTLQPA
jgi:hypothetical protein